MSIRAFCQVMCAVWVTVGFPAFAEGGMPETGATISDGSTLHIGLDYAAPDQLYDLSGGTSGSDELECESPDGAFIVTRQYDHHGKIGCSLLRVWDANTGAHTPPILIRQLWDTGWTGDSKILLVADENAILHIDPATGKCLKRLAYPQADAVQFPQFLPDGKQVIMALQAFGSSSLRFCHSKVVLMDTTTGAVSHEMTGLASRISGITMISERLAFLKSAWLLSDSAVVYDVISQKVLMRFEGKQLDVEHAVENGKYIVLSDYANGKKFLVLRLEDAATTTFSCQDGDVLSEYEGRLVLCRRFANAGQHKNTIELVEPDGTPVQKIFTGHLRNAACKEGTLLLVCPVFSKRGATTGATLSWVDLSTGKQIRTLPNWPTRNICFSRTADTVIGTGGNIVIAGPKGDPRCLLKRNNPGISQQDRFQWGIIKKNIIVMHALWNETVCLSMGDGSLNPASGQMSGMKFMLGRNPAASPDIEYSPAFDCHDSEVDASHVQDTSGHCTTLLEQQIWNILTAVSDTCKSALTALNNGKLLSISNPLRIRKMPDGTITERTDRNQHLQLFDLATGIMEKDWPLPTTGRGFLKMHISEDETLALLLGTNYYAVFDLKNGENLISGKPEYIIPKDEDESIISKFQPYLFQCGCISPDKKLAAIAAGNGWITLVDLAKKRQVAQICISAGAPNMQGYAPDMLAFSEDCRHFYAGCFVDGFVLRWETAAIISRTVPAGAGAPAL